ncbi:MAG: hypothetical protein IDH24_22410 [Gordonia sp.]|nr:hypothetical protein [Gordonia sp. (in: high G+C Gram-positive bacteria)]
MLGAGTGAVVVVVAAAMKACGAGDAADKLTVPGSKACGSSTSDSGTVDAAGPVVSAPGSIGVPGVGSMTESAPSEFVSSASVEDGAEYSVADPVPSGSDPVHDEVAGGAGVVAGGAGVVAGE